MLRQLLAAPAFQFLIGRTIGLYMLLVGAATRWTRVNQAAVEPFWRGESSVVLCIWHGRFLLTHKMWAFGPGVPKAKMLISQSREGGVVAHASRTVGAEVIRGSAAKRVRRKRDGVVSERTQSKGGPGAMRAMARHIEDGGIIAMTPDGPRGPRMRARLGPIQIAKLAQAPMLALAWSTSRRKVFENSWDKFILPLPFGRGALVWGNPIAPPAPDASDADIEAVRLQLEAEMLRICSEADRIAGVASVEPAPATATPAASERVAAQ